MGDKIIHKMITVYPDRVSEKVVINAPPWFQGLADVLYLVHQLGELAVPCEFVDKDKLHIDFFYCSIAEDPAEDDQIANILIDLAELYYWESRKRPPC